jgi:hypothetical protein
MAARGAQQAVAVGQRGDQGAQLVVGHRAKRANCGFPGVCVNGRVRRRTVAGIKPLVGGRSGRSLLERRGALTPARAPRVSDPAALRPRVGRRRF